MSLLNIATILCIGLAERTERDKERAADQERQRKNKDRARLHRLIKEEKVRVEALHRTMGAANKRSPNGTIPRSVVQAEIST